MDSKPVGFMFVFIVCCVGSDHCDEVITRTDKSYRVFVCVCVFVCLIVCDLETTTTRWPKPDLGCCATENDSEPFVTLSKMEGRRKNFGSEKHIYMCFSESPFWHIAKLINANFGSQIVKTGQCFIVKETLI